MQKHICDKCDFKKYIDRKSHCYMYDIEPQIDECQFFRDLPKPMNGDKVKRVIPVVMSK